MRSRFDIGGISQCDGENAHLTPVSKSNLLCKTMKMGHDY